MITVIFIELVLCWAIVILNAPRLCCEALDRYALNKQQNSKNNTASVGEEDEKH